MTASELSVGDVLRTAIGKAPVKTISPSFGGLEIVLDLDSPLSTRPRAHGAVLWFYPRQPVFISTSRGAGKRSAAGKGKGRGPAEKRS